jgi:hypothetical protein
LIGSDELLNRKKDLLKKLDDVNDSSHRQYRAVEFLFISNAFLVPKQPMNLIPIAQLCEQGLTAEPLLALFFVRDCLKGKQVGKQRALSREPFYDVCRKRTLW